MKNVEHALHPAPRLIAAAAAVAAALLGTAAWAKEDPPKEPHPKHAEVAKRDRHLAGQMNKDYGNLSGHYNQLQKQDAAIRKQANADMKANGGHLTKAQQKQLNGEENALRSEMNADKGPPPKTQFEQNHPRRAEVCIATTGSMARSMRTRESWAATTARSSNSSNRSANRSRRTPTPTAATSPSRSSNS